MSHRFAAAVAFLLTLAGQAAEPTREPADKFAQRFYSTLLKVKPLGIPSATQWTKLRPFFTSDVAAVIEKDQREEAAAAKKHPDEPPVFGDGFIFCSLYEGPSRFAVGKPVPHGTGTRVPVALANTSGREHTAWTDTLSLVPSPAGWQIREIEFGGKWAFKSGTSFRNSIGLKK